MWKLKFCLVTICVASSLAMPYYPNPEYPDDPYDCEYDYWAGKCVASTKDIKISRFHVNTDIQMRYDNYIFCKPRKINFKD